MKYLNFVDYSIIAGYMLILLAIGQYLRKRASASLDDYFLAGRKMPWWALGISSMAAWLDMTGTMVIVSFLYLLGPRGLYVEIRGGACLVLVFLMLWTGKWHRRSGAMTGAEWIAIRFGQDFWGNFARLASVFAMVIFSLGLLAYSFVGAGLFLSMFLPFTPLTCTVIMMLVTTLYTLESGFYGVVVTDVFQSLCIWIAVIFVIIMAGLKTSGADIAAVASAITGNQEWITTIPTWKTSMPAGYENYSLLWVVGGFYLFKTIIQGMGTGADPKYFGARSDRECGLLSFMCGWLMMLRWPLMLGFAILGLFLVKDLFPDQSVLTQAADLIKANYPNITKSGWAELTAKILNHPDLYPVDLVNSLKNLLGSEWASKLSMVSFEGTVNPERILPAVLLFNIPMGLRGLIIVALLAAAMSTFNAIINMTTGFLTRDLYQAYLRPKASNKELIYISYGFSVLQVIFGMAMAYSTESINAIWGWLMMGLSAGMIVPAVLRLHWWRFNGGGYAIGTMTGMIAAIFQWYLWRDMSEQLQLVYILAIGITASVTGTYLTQPTPLHILENYYKKIRPFGLWGRFKHLLPPDVLAATKKEHFNDIISVPFTFGWMITILLMPMQLMVKAYGAFWATFSVFAVCMVGLYFFWYRNLPPANVAKNCVCENQTDLSEKAKIREVKI
jgi:solute:Na+ symporter, SSS family